MISPLAAALVAIISVTAAALPAPHRRPGPMWAQSAMTVGTTMMRLAVGTGALWLAGWWSQ